MKSEQEIRNVLKYYEENENIPPNVAHYWKAILRWILEIEEQENDRQNNN